MFMGIATFFFLVHVFIYVCVSMILVNSFLCSFVENARIKRSFSLEIQFYKPHSNPFTHVHKFNHFYTHLRRHEMQSLKLKVIKKQIHATLTIIINLHKHTHSAQTNEQRRIHQLCISKIKCKYLYSFDMQYSLNVKIKK